MTGGTEEREDQRGIPQRTGSLACKRPKVCHHVRDIYYCKYAARNDRPQI